VRVVYDGVNGNQLLEASKATGKEFNAVLTMKSAGIPLVNAGRNSGLMHNKFILIDGQILFTGSWNMSYNDTFRNNNNLLEITDPTLIANYQAKFDDLYLKKHFGARSRVGALVPEVSIGGVKVDNYFSPTDPVMKKLLALVNGATKSIHFMAYTFTDQDLAKALIARYQQGLDVQGVIESRSVIQSSLPDLFCAGVPVKEDGNAYNMHHKVLIIDDHIVVTGSFNFTESADSINDENVLVIDSPQVAQQYLAEFDRVNAIAKTPTDITCK
jgi:phosphatidylserine/phosphatidylglycerophosphate/cardiolipin synthase-like enzyme